jgi:hypothetical protein
MKADINGKGVPMSVYVKNGTPLDGPALCETCSYGFIRLGYRMGEALVICRWTEPNNRVDFRVRDCSAYHDKTRPSMYQMEQIASVIRVDLSKEMAGFSAGNDAAIDKELVELLLEDKQSTSN